MKLVCVKTIYAVGVGEPVTTSRFRCVRRVVYQTELSSRNRLSGPVVVLFSAMLYSHRNVDVKRRTVIFSPIYMPRQNDLFSIQLWYPSTGERDDYILYACAPLCSFDSKPDPVFSVTVRRVYVCNAFF